MRKLFYVFVVIVSLTACELETSNNGGLDGYWQLYEMDTLATGTTADMKESKIFWSIQHHLLETLNPTIYGGGVLFRFEQWSDSLRIWNPVNDNKMISDSIVTDEAKLQPYGVHLTDTFCIEILSSKHMVLKGRRYRFRFNRY